MKALGIHNVELQVSKTRYNSDESKISPVSVDAS